MRLSRRKFLPLAIGAATPAAISRTARAETYPARAVKILVGFSAGGAVDIVARVIGQWLSERFHQQFFVENRPGAANNIATADMIKSEPDGYTLLLSNPTNAINASLYPDLKYNFLRDSAAVAGIMRVPDVMVVGTAVPAHSIAEFITYAKDNPGKVYYASPGNGTSPHMAAESFKLMAHIELLNITYRGMGGGGYTDLLSGRVQVSFDNLPGVIGYIRSGQLRALGVTTKNRAQQLPDVPCISEVLPGYEVGVFYGLSAPKNTPIGRIGNLNKEINAGLADRKLRLRLTDLGGTLIPGSPADFGKLVADETEKWATVIRAANIKLQ